MDVVLKISNDYTPETTQAQFINPSDLNFSQELVNSGTLGFTLALSDHQISSIIEMKKATLYSIEDGTDKLLWSGYLDEIVNDFGYVFIKCGDEKDFLRSKMTFGDIHWAGISVQTGMTALLNEVNLRRGPNEGLLTLETDVGATIIGKDFSTGTSLFDIIDQFTQALNLEWKVLFNKIYIKTTVGIDRSIAGANYIQVIWNNQSPNENTITSFKNSRRSRDIATSIIGKSNSGIAVYAGDLSTYGSVERSISMDPGILATQTQEYVQKHQNSQIERDIGIIISDEEARIIEVGDLVAVKIIHGSPLADADTNLKVIQKGAVFENKKPTVTIKLATDTKEVSSMQNFLASLNRRIKRFELY
ncbi:MAG: hypothetical protein V4549_03675 [Bacteroidota bacterium]